MEGVKEVVGRGLVEERMEELGERLGKMNEWRKGECEGIGGKRMGKMEVVEGD